MSEKRSENYFKCNYYILFVINFNYITILAYISFLIKSLKCSPCILVFIQGFIFHLKKKKNFKINSFKYLMYKNYNFIVLFILHFLYYQIEKILKCKDGVLIEKY